MYRFVYIENDDNREDYFNLKINGRDNILAQGYVYLRGELSKQLFRDYSGDRSNLQNVKAYIFSKTSTSLEELEQIQSIKDVRRVLASDSNVKSKYTIVSIATINECSGCRYEACGQMAHMECPDGCLHDPDECDDCQYLSDD